MAAAAAAVGCCCRPRAELLDASASVCKCAARRGQPSSGGLRGHGLGLRSQGLSESVQLQPSCCADANEPRFGSCVAFKPFQPAAADVGRSCWLALCLVIGCSKSVLESSMASCAAPQPSKLGLPADCPPPGPNRAAMLALSCAARPVCHARLPAPQHRSLGRPAARRATRPPPPQRAAPPTSHFDADQSEEDSDEPASYGDVSQVTISV